MQTKLQYTGNVVTVDSLLGHHNKAWEIEGKGENDVYSNRNEIIKYCVQIPLPIMRTLWHDLTHWSPEDLNEILDK